MALPFSMQRLRLLCTYSLQWASEHAVRELNENVVALHSFLISQHMSPCTRPAVARVANSPVDLSEQAWSC